MPRKPRTPLPPSAAASPTTSKSGGSTGTTQPPPPAVGGSAGTVPWTPGGGKKDGELEAAAAIYAQLLEVRKVVEQLRQETVDEKLRRRLDLVPVRVGDLMRGFQAAMARANLANRAGGEDEGEDIEQMAIKNLEVSVTAPVIDAGHAEDPVLMLPNIKSPDASTAQVSLKFSVVSVPARKGS
ncbi:MAG: hypothetical protein ABUT39_07085 [Acidobacteriota bacterium]